MGGGRSLKGELPLPLPVTGHTGHAGHAGYAGKANRRHVIQPGASDDVVELGCVRDPDRFGDVGGAETVVPQPVAMPRRPRPRFSFAKLVAADLCLFAWSGANGIRQWQNSLLAHLARQRSRPREMPVIRMPYHGR